MGVGVCVLQVTLAYESIVLYMCEGKVLMDMECSIKHSQKAVTASNNAASAGQ